MTFPLSFEKSKGPAPQLSYLTSRDLRRERSILIAFTDRSGGNLAFHVGDDPAAVVRKRKSVMSALGVPVERLVCAEQVHGARVARVTEREVGRGSLSLNDAIPQTDALVTNLKHTPLAVFTADCLPVILVDPTRRVVGVVHAGRRGVYLAIVPETLTFFRETFSSAIKDVLAFIGPGIGRCCYPVDLRGTVRDQLVASGVARNQIYVSEWCTSCQNNLLFSYRKDPMCGRQAAVAAILDSAD